MVTSKNSIFKNLVATFCGALLCASLAGCSGSGDSFETCESSTVAGLRGLSSRVEGSSLCRTIYGEVSFQFSGRCARSGCFFLYDVDEDGNRVRGDSIYLSDVSAFPSGWQDSSAVRLARVTGDFYPEKKYDSCESLADVECQRAFYVRDVE